VGEQKILILYDNEKFAHEIQYTFEVLFSILGTSYVIIPYSRYDSEGTMPILVLSYGVQKPFISGKAPSIHIHASDFFGDGYLTRASLPKRPLPSFKDLPVIYSGNGKLNSLVERSKALIETDVDIIASSFFMLTRYEEIILYKEIVANREDRYERFPATASLAYREGFLDRPVVNEYIELLWKWIRGFNLGLKRKNPWSDKNFAVCLTHDVDQIKRYKSYPPLGSIRRSLIRKHIRKALLIFSDYLKTKIHIKEDPFHDVYYHMLDLEKESGFKSSFYFLAHEGDYSLEDRWLKGFLKVIQEEGFEIGLHTAFPAYNKPTVIKKEKERLEEIINRTILGIRQHHLKCEIPTSWRSWREASLEYDTTLCFDDQWGFRAGICYPFKVFDLGKGVSLDLWEVPLIIMDCTLDHWGNLSPEEGRCVLSKFSKVVEKYNGLLVVLFHANYMCQLFEPDWKRSFEDFYRSLANKDCLVETVANTLTIWRNSIGKETL